MKKFNKILCMVTALIMILSALSACDDGTEPDATVSDASVYTVYFVDQNSTPVSGVLVLFTDVNGGSKLVISGEDGSVTMESQTAVDSVAITTMPTGYTCDKLIHTFGNSRELTVTLTADVVQDTAITYSVTVVDAAGNPVSGVELQFCDETSCRLPVVTDANGKVTEKYEKSQYHVTVNAVPEGYTAEQTVYYFDTEATELTITLSGK